MFEFEKNKDTAIRYNRDLWINTIQAMEKIDKIRQDREKRFWENRMRKSHHDKKEMIKANLMKHDSLIRNVQTRQKVLAMKDAKEEQKKMKRMQLRSKKNLNLGLNEDMEDEQSEDYIKELPKVNPNTNITTRRKHKMQLRKQKQKQRNLAEKKARFSEQNKAQMEIE